ncbi:MAG: HAD family phosphatase [Bacillaceae bacterium]|nr:HAD family phosphatase [Bacillaceae bacterium]
MNYKMVMIDLDDTLLTDELTITPETREAIQKAVQKGVIVTLATGRMYASARPIAARLGINVPIITYQGALVKGLLDRKTLYEKKVAPSIARVVYDIAVDQGLHLQIYQNDTLYVQEDNEKVRQYSHVAGVPYNVEKDFPSLLENPSTKLLYFEDPVKLDEIKIELVRRFGDKAYITKSKPYFLEILHPDASKGQAMRFLSDYFDVPLSRTIAIGDSYNDLDMLETAGLGVAMGNAVDSLKEKADYISATNNENGVKQVLDEFVLS